MGTVIFCKNTQFDGHKMYPNNTRQFELRLQYVIMCAIEENEQSWKTNKRNITTV